MTDKMDDAEFEELHAKRAAGHTDDDENRRLKAEERRRAVEDDNPTSPQATPLVQQVVDPRAVGPDSTRPGGPDNGVPPAPGQVRNAAEQQEREAAEAQRQEAERQDSDRDSDGRESDGQGGEQPSHGASSNRSSTVTSIDTAKSKSDGPSSARTTGTGSKSR